MTQQPFAASQDADHVRLLSIFYYVYGGITALMSLIPIVHVAMGIAIVSGAIPMPSGPSAPPPPVFAGFHAFGWLFIAIGGTIIIIGETMAALALFTARFLSQRHHHTFCIVVAAINCLHMPLGTALGVFSLIVLSRPSVKLMFNPGGSVGAGQMPVGYSYGPG